MRFFYFLIPLLGLVTVGIFVYGLVGQPGQSFNLSQLIQKPEPSADEPLTLLFTGDLMLTRGVGVSIWNNGGGNPRYPFLKIADTLRGADLAIGNLEGPISSRGTKVGSIYSFRHPTERLDGLTFAGFDALSLANNHIWDYGREALEDTLDLLRNSGVAPVGAGRNFEEANAPYVAEVKGTRIAFFSYTNLYPPSLWATADAAGVSTPVVERVEQSIAAIRDSVDLVVVLWHWGDEYQPRSHPREQAIARALLDAGADLIVGHHPHVVQEIEFYKGKFIAYSLGNFVFDQGFSEETMRGFMLRVVVRDKKIVAAVPFPIQLSDTFQPSLGWRRFPFLKNLPFEKLEPAVALVEGFSAYEGILGDTPGDVHRGIDYARMAGDKFLPFDIFSMHDGTAMQGESKTWGNFVIVRYEQSPTLRYYTIYAHLTDIPERFPDLRTVRAGEWRGVPVAAGEFLGRAGVSGNTNGITQLHLELQEEDLATPSNGTGRWLKLDPYGIYGQAGAYPQTGEMLAGLKHYWTSDGPAYRPGRPPLAR